jgi:hypothetical protein
MVKLARKVNEAFCLCLPKSRKLMKVLQAPCLRRKGRGEGGSMQRKLPRNAKEPHPGEFPVHDQCSLSWMGPEQSSPQGTCSI